MFNFVFFIHTQTPCPAPALLRGQGLEGLGGGGGVMTHHLKLARQRPNISKGHFTSRPLYPSLCHFPECDTASWKAFE